MPDNPHQWLSTKEVAVELGITLRTVYRLIDDGELEAFKFGRVIRMKRMEIDRYMEVSKIEAGTLTHLYPTGTTKQVS